MNFQNEIELFTKNENFSGKNIKTNFDKSISELEKNLLNFDKNKTIDNYYKIIDNIIHLNYLENINESISLYTDPKYNHLKLSKIMNEKFSNIFNPYLKKIINFLEKNINNDKSFHTQINYFKSFNFNTTKINNYYNEYLNKNKNVIIDRINLDDNIISSSLNKTRKGYILNAFDANCLNLLNNEKDETKRKIIYEKLNNEVISNDDINNFVSLFNEETKQFNEKNYLDLLNQNNVLSTKTIKQNILKFLNKTAKKRGKLENTYFDVDISKPWNFYYHQSTIDSISINSYSDLDKEFPLDRVINFIIPDILSIGNWEVVSIEKIKNNSLIYLYHLNNKVSGREAYIYFSPFKNSDLSDLESFQAYVMNLKYENVRKNTKDYKICFVMQNLTVVNNYLTSYEDLVFLAHEMGHVLHNIHSQDTYFMTKSNHLLTEVPSVFLESLAYNVDTLIKWSNTKKYKKFEKLVNAYKIKSSLFKKYEDAYIEMELISKNKNMEDSYINTRKKLGLNTPNKGNNLINYIFDYSPLLGTKYLYIIGDSLSRDILGKNPTDKKIRKEMLYLLDNILDSSMYENNLKSLWLKHYKKTFNNSFSSGIDKISIDYNSFIGKLL